MTNLSRFGLCLAVLLSLVSGAFAQSWGRAYEEGLKAGRGNQWAEARESFRQAMAYRPEDASLPTFLPGTATERRRWREGAPYSPNFLAAYSLYRDVLKKPKEQQGGPLRIAGAELESLLDKGQTSREAFYLLDQIYQKVGDETKRTQTSERFTREGSRIKWRVDTELLTPEETAAITAMAGSSVAKPGGDDPGTGGAVVTAPGRVPALPTKFAIVIGNSETKVTSLAVPHAAGDARRVRDALIANAGYFEENIAMVVNGTGEQMLAAAKALATRVPADGTVFVYFAGGGVNLSDADYLLGTDAASATETKGMIAKREFYDLFLARKARIFAFFESHRPIAAGRYFGSEIPSTGSVSQVQATMPGEAVTSHLVNGRPAGTFTAAMIEVLSDLKSNRIPILEFGWQVFYKIRRGGLGTKQTPTLPVLTNLASDAKF